MTQKKKHQLVKNHLFFGRRVSLMLISACDLEIHLLSKNPIDMRWVAAEIGNNDIPNFFIRFEMVCTLIVNM